MEKVRRPRRSWSDEEKRRIVAETYAPGGRYRKWRVGMT